MGPSQAPIGPTFEIRIAGAVPLEVLRELGDLTMTAQELRTVMVCRLPDQAALHGFLARLRSLGLELVEVRSVGSSSAVPDVVGQP